MHLLVLGNTLAALVAPILLYVLVRRLFNKRRASAHRNAEDPNPGAPSRSMPQIEANYEVFLSFRGIDTRKSFADYLYYGLIDAGICVFKDDDEFRAGEKIGSDLLEVIEKSKILIPIISPNYASSKWCLDELIHMMECNKRLGNIVLPIFYKVKSADVRRQSGDFGWAFDYYGRRFDQKVVEKWKQALKEVAFLRGWESEQVANGHEGKLVKSVVREVLNELKKAMELVFGDCLVGIDSYVEEVMELVNKSSGSTLYIGIYGVGGIGKTTLVKIIYNKLSNLFEYRSFIADIKESCESNGIKYLQNQLIFDILKIQLNDKDDGINSISSKFKDKKVMIVLDDVDMNNQLVALVGNPNWFAPGSRIFVTTRKEGLLNRARVDIKYEHKEMDEEQSLILFSRHAFRRESPPSECLALSRLVVSILGGFPLVLKIVGFFLCGKQPSLWRDTIQKMQNVPHKAVREKLRISYEELEEDQRQMFLDIACFLIGSDARVASYMWDACGFCTRVGIEVLRSLSFIYIGDHHELRMQNQIRDLGREIVREENCELHKRSRLWNKEEAFKVLEGNKGTEKIQAICLENGNSTRIAKKDYSGYINDQASCIFTDEQFSNLPSLRFIHMNDVNLIGDYDKIFSQLKWLKWESCSPSFVANNFHARELVILDMSRSLISDEWCGWISIMTAKKLKVLNLTGCCSLKRTSYLSAFERLEILILRDCCKLQHINPCIGDLQTLVSLNLSGCSRLTELPQEMGNLEQLKELLLDQITIREIPSSIGSLEKLETLSAKDCKFLRRLPNSIGQLVNLSTLVLSGCVKIATLPDSIGFLVNLRCLSLRRCQRLRKIPNSIGKLKLLTLLDLRECSCLEELPAQMGELEQLKELLQDQTMIREIPSSIGSLRKLETLSAKDCKSFLSPDAPSMLFVRFGRVLTGRHVTRSRLGGPELQEPTSVDFLPKRNRLTLPLMCCHRFRKILNSIGMFDFLTQLRLSKCSHLKELPPQIGELEQLKELILDRTMIREIPSSIGSLMKLHKFSVEDCKVLVGLPDSIGRLVSLLTLDLSGCVELAAFPTSIEFLVTLEFLLLGRCHQLREIPNSIGKLELLTQLDLSWTTIKELPESIGDLQYLKVLDVGHSSIEKLPGGIGRLKRLQMLRAEDCKLLLELPNSIGCLVGLRCLSLSRCHRLREIPNSIGKLKFLTILDLSWTMIKELPESIGDLQFLKGLDISHCSIEKLPDGIGRLKRLEMLRAEDCKLLLELPHWIGCLVGLRCLSLRRCDRLREIPNSIGKLKFLTILDLSWTMIKELPESIGNLQNLKVLDIIHSSIEMLPYDIGGRLKKLKMLSKLELLSAKGCKYVLELHGLIGRLVDWWWLSLERCDRLGELPSLFQASKSWTHLNSLETTIMGLLASIQNLQSVEYLYISHRSTEKLPYGI